MCVRLTGVDLLSLDAVDLVHFKSVRDRTVRVARKVLVLGSHTSFDNLLTTLLEISIHRFTLLYCILICLFLFWLLGLSPIFLVFMCPCT